MVILNSSLISLYTKPKANMYLFKIVNHYYIYKVFIFPSPRFSLSTNESVFQEYQWLL